MNDIVPGGKYKDKRWDEVPTHYLQFCGDKDSEFGELCREQLARRATKQKQLHVLPSAVDSASFCIMDKWKKSVEAGEFTKGFYSYVIAIGTQATQQGESDNDGNVYYRNFHFKVNWGELYPTLISVGRVPGT